MAFPQTALLYRQTVSTRLLYNRVCSGILTKTTSRFETLNFTLQTVYTTRGFTTDSIPSLAVSALLFCEATVYEFHTEIFEANSHVPVGTIM